MPVNVSLFCEKIRKLQAELKNLQMMKTGLEICLSYEKETEIRAELQANIDKVNLKIMWIKLEFNSLY